ncbi:hypothetical protein MCOR02_002800 [Pyricularia oryzae]|nr:hypothetical protein MCOR02_002800 [Pyricularia oryzae]KAI6310346.1 hypothetical protein MCOR34_006394 [Pyricularia oryzae]KAI6473267.1 hypothetical protein MCOR17_002706 [Pyricularia oryzae]KAI6491404.1 hypothetical protein MCOR13_008257 [Pyricularia oryzae]KAI6608091.1 hypothetical protein MCOR04_000357 [Pyricularia oryzae]
MDPQKIYDQVRAHYSAASQGTTAAYGSAIAKSFGYSAEELAHVPEGSNLGLSCGNPLAIASVGEGETVIDLGSGAGFDAFAAAEKAGPSGNVIGVDMNEDMLARASEIKAKLDKTNVEFVKSSITDISILESGIADCIISNCVINLVPAAEKHLVFKEIFRLLKPGGRLAVSDILAKKPMPEKIRSDIALYVGCISGASTVSEYEEFLKDAGFKEILISDSKGDLNVYTQIGEDGLKKTDCCASTKAKNEESVGRCKPSSDTNVGLVETDLNQWAGKLCLYSSCYQIR